MATGDITPTIPNLDGGAVDLLIEGFTTGADWDVGEGSGVVLLDLDNADAVLTLTGDGYNADGTVNSSATYTSRLNAVRRKAYPNEASEDQDTSGSDLDIRCNADRWLWTGYTATITAAAALVTNSGGASQTSNALSGASVTNNETLAVPKVLAQWDLPTSVPAQRVSADFTVGIEAYHHFGIACVEFTATGVTSAHEQTVRVTTKTPRQSATTSFWGEAYEATIPIAGFTQGETITINAVVKPNVGPSSSVLDTADTTGADNEILLRSNLSFTCNKTGALTQYAYVDTGSGNDGTGVVSGTEATAQASPYATIAAALNDGATDVVLTAGTHTLTSVNPDISNTYWYEIRAATGASVTLTTSATLNYDVDRLKISGVTLTGSDIWDGDNAANRFLWFHNVTMGVTGGSPGLGYRAKGVYFTECDGPFDYINSFSTNRVAYAFDGCSLEGTLVCNCAYRFKRCYMEDGLLSSKPSGNPAPEQEGVIFSNFRVEVADRDDLAMAFDFDCSVGIAFINFILERHGTGTSTAPLAQLWADNSVNPLNNMIVSCSTGVGQRLNMCYNDTGTAAVSRTNVLFISGAWENGFNIKGDPFGTPNANRVGNFPTTHGTGVFHNRAYNTTFPADDTAGGGQRGAHGPNTINYEGGTSLGFVDDQSLNGGNGNAGGGDYEPDTGSVLLEELPEAYQFTDYDLYGTLLESNADIGAVQRAIPVLAVVSDPNGTPVEISDGGEIDKGTVTNGVTVSIPFALRNDGNVTLTFDGDDASITGTNTANYDKGSGSWTGEQEIAPGETLQLAVTFNSAMSTLSAGEYVATLNIVTNDADSPFNIDLSCTIAESGGGSSAVVSGNYGINLGIRIGV